MPGLIRLPRTTIRGVSIPAQAAKNQLHNTWTPAPNRNPGQVGIYPALDAGPEFYPPVFVTGTEKKRIPCPRVNPGTGCACTE